MWELVGKHFEAAICAQGLKGKDAGNEGTDGECQQWNQTYKKELNVNSKTENSNS